MLSAPNTLGPVAAAERAQSRRGAAAQTENISSAAVLLSNTEVLLKKII